MTPHMCNIQRLQSWADCGASARATAASLFLAVAGSVRCRCAARCRQLLVYGGQQARGIHSLHARHLLAALEEQELQAGATVCSGFGSSAHAINGREAHMLGRSPAPAVQQPPRPSAPAVQLAAAPPLAGWCYCVPPAPAHRGTSRSRRWRGRAVAGLRAPLPPSAKRWAALVWAPPSRRTAPPLQAVGQCANSSRCRAMLHRQHRWQGAVEAACAESRSHSCTLESVALQSICQCRRVGQGGGRNQLWSLHRPVNGGDSSGRVGQGVLSSCPARS